MYNLLIIFVSAALLRQDVGYAANVNKNMQPDQIEMDNSIQPNVIPTKHSNMKKFVHITQRPPTTVTHNAGRALELTCDAMGSPAPSVQWLKNDVPILEYDLETNEILDSSVSSLARASSTLIISVPSENEEDTYTCIVLAGQKMQRASTTVYTTGTNPDLAERYRLVPMKPRIVFNYKVYMDTIGNNVVLPCKSKGHPHPTIYWRDNTGEMIYRRNPRMKILKSGELLISNLRWSDMGEYSCTAKNAFGKEISSTFIYPVKAG